MTKASVKAKRPKTRRITVNITIEVDIAERKIPLMLKEFPELLDGFRDGDKERQLGAVWSVVYDCQDPIAEYQYLRSEGGKERDVRDVRIADKRYLASIGYGRKRSPTPGTA
jgi:hypothetical protein